MSQPEKRRPGDSTVIAGKTEGKSQRISATQILSAAEARAIKRTSGKKPGDSSVILSDERIRRTGLGVSVKFALAISTALAAFMLLFGVVVSGDLRDSLNEEIDAAGVSTARSLALADYFTWNVYHGAYAGTDYAKWEESISKGERKIPEGALTKPEIDRAEKRVGVNRKRLERILTSDERILNALIYSADRSKFSLQAGGDAQLNFTGQQQPDRDGVKVEYGIFQNKAGREYRARQYSAPIVDDDGKTIEGWATIILSEESIQQKISAVQTHLAVLALVFILLGVGVAFWMGGRITKPITDLTHDVEIIAKGNLDHHPKIVGRDEIGVLARTVDRMTKSLHEAQNNELEHAKQKHQLQVALEIQANLFPKNLPALPGYDVSSHYQAGPEVGGDYYDVIVLPDGRWLMMVASASGKGIPAAMLTTMARSFITALAEREKSPSDLLRVVNRLLSPDLRRGMYVTALMCLLDPRTGKLVVANAGHNPLILFSGAEKKVKPIHSDGIALGFDKGPIFDRSLREIEIELKVGDRIVLCTKGLFTIRSHEEQELGEGRFFQLVEREGAKDSGAFVKLVSHTLEKYAEGGWMETDVTFVTLQRTS
jgi:serine phosphatase RsbU (regulator of sigma subunit)